jgi:hypothetical protein
MRRSLVNVSGAMIRGAARRLGIPAAGAAGGRSSGTSAPERAASPVGCLTGEATPHSDFHSA